MTKSKSKIKPKSRKPAQPPEFDRSGEMPLDAAPIPSTPASAQTQDGQSRKTAEKASGLAAVDLSQPPTRSSGRFQEYQDGDAEPANEANSAAVDSRDVPTPGREEGTGDNGQGEDVPAALEEVQVVKVKRKKKKEGGKKKDVAG
jgi:hypothetical protein